MVSNRIVVMSEIGAANRHRKGSSAAFKPSMNDTNIMTSKSALRRGDWVSFVIDWSALIREFEAGLMQMVDRVN